MAAMVDILSEMEKAPQPRREMRHVGYWEIICQCGREVRAREAETTCPHCGRMLVIEWGPTGR